MSRVVYLHIGAPKTGTTYLQDRLALNAKRLSANGITFPTKSLLADPALFHFRAALDLLDQDWGGTPGHAEGAWPAMVRRVRRASDTAIISHEILAPAPTEKVAKAMNDLDGAEIHVVYSTRDLARQLPAAWQESIKQGRAWRFQRFLTAAEARNAWFMRAFDLPAVLNRWTRNLPPEQVHVVTVPPAGAAPDELWLRFCRALGIDPDWAPLDSERSNESLGMAETEVLRRLNRRIERRPRREAAADELIREMLHEQGFMPNTSPKVELPPERFEWVEAEALRWIDWLKGSGVDVVGDLDDLLPGPPPGDWRNPDRVPRKDLANAAIDALVAMTQEAASRPDPSRELGARIKSKTEKLRQR